MSSKRRRINGFVPIDKLAGDTTKHTDHLDGGSHANQNVEHLEAVVPKRYKEYRKDFRVVQHLNHLSSKDFLPSPSRSKVIERHPGPTDSQDEDESIRDSSDSGEEEEFESLEGTPPMKRVTKSSNGLLSSSPFDIWKNGSNVIITKFNISGSLRTIDVRKKMDEKFQCLLKFVNDSAGPRITFTHKNFEIKNAQIDFRKDCERAVFDKDYSCMGMMLRAPRFIDMDNKSKIGRVQTKLLVWASSDSAKSNKIHKIKDIFLNIKKFKIEVVANKKLLIRMLDDLAVQEYKNKVMTINNSTNTAIEKLKNRRHFWEKTEFQSLGSQNRLSNYKNNSSSYSGQKISIPTIPSSPENSSSNDVESNSLPNVSPLNFYSKPSADKSKTDTGQTTVYSTLRKSSRKRSETPNLVQSTLWDLEDSKKFETPQTLEPSLYYKFTDGASYTITNQDFKCLYNHDWINDSILDFFTKFYAERSIEKSVMDRNEMHIMSSFFYTKLVSNSDDYYGNVKKWVTNCDLFRKKYVVVPINMNFHWFGCIITNLDMVLDFFGRSNEGFHDGGNTATSLDGHKDNHAEGSDRSSLTKNQPPSDQLLVNDKGISVGEDEEVVLSTPIITILTFDSLRQTHTREIDPIKEFLIAYAKDKHGIDLDKALIKMKTCAVPQQPNMSDCGVHVILNNMKFFDNPKETIEVWRSARPRNKSSGRIVNEYFEKAKRDTARKSLRRVIWDLHEKQLLAMKENGDPSNSYFKGPYNQKTQSDDGEEGDIEIIEDINEYKRSLGKSGGVYSDHSNSKLLHSAVTTPHHNAQNTRNTRNNGGSDILSLDVAEEIPAAQNEDGGTIRDLQVCSPPSNKSSNFEKYRVDRSPIEKIVLASPRKFLESSPIRKSSGGTASDLTSPYFGDSSLKSRADTFERSSPSRRSVNLNGFLTVENRFNSSSAEGEFPLSKMDSLEGGVATPGTKPASDSIDLSASPFRHEKSIISDVEQDDDVNLIGDPKLPCSLSRVRDDVEKELNDSIIDMKVGKSNAAEQRESSVPNDTYKPFYKNSEKNADSEKVGYNSSITIPDNDVETIHSDEDTHKP